MQKKKSKYVQPPRHRAAIKAVISEMMVGIRFTCPHCGRRALHEETVFGGAIQGVTWLLPCTCGQWVRVRKRIDDSPQPVKRMR